MSALVVRRLATRTPAAVAEAPATEPPPVVEPQPPTPPPVPAPSPAPTAGLQRLQELTAPLEAAGEASSHPRDLARHDAFREAVAILRSPEVSRVAVLDYATGANFMLSAAALAALAERPDRNEACPAIERHFRHLPPWPVFYALHYFTRVHQRPPAGALVLYLPEYWGAHALVPTMFAEHFDARLTLGDIMHFGDSLEAASQSDLTNAEVLLRKIQHPAATTLVERLAGWRHRTLDRSYLETFGRFVVPDTTALVEHDAIRDQLDAAQAALLEFPHRSVLVAAGPRSGKTSFIMLLAERAAARGWVLFEAGSGDLISGQTYIGQLEERLRRLAAELSVDKRVIWYAPDFLQLAASGTHTGQAASVLDQIFPAIASGRVVVVSETTSSALTTLVQQRQGLLSTLEVVRLRALTDLEIDRLLQEFALLFTTATELKLSGAVLVAAAHLARHYLGSERLPGAAIDLMKLAAQAANARGARLIERGDVLGAMSRLTGMPPIVLDDRERVDLAALRRFFTDRVLGQDEAVEAMVDRIAMLKAGLTDPGKPIGVFLFAGPTGTGKTELAKTLAEFLFGSPERLLRLDMSEFQAFESTRKILGAPDQPDPHALTHRVRNQPFSVVLLDEFEKAHSNVWDLFLQVFDDGRLTDGTGQTVDFRHCIIILTSNLGSTIAQGAGPGFGQAGSRFSPEHVTRAVNQSFRPEFVNRLDAIIVFRPLTRELMRSIITRELARVLERRGLRDREWAVEWESSALDFLLDKGFSPAMGARPLKRAIDRYLLAPLAATLVEHRVPEGDQFLFVRSDGRAIQVEFVDPDRPPEPKGKLEAEPRPGTGPTLPRMMLQPSGSAEEHASLIAERQRLEARLASEPWGTIEEALAAEMQQPEFWSHAGRYRTLARYALMDRVKAALGTAAGLEARLGRADRGGRYSRDLIARLASQLHMIGHGVEDALMDAPVEVVLAVQPVLEAGSDQAEVAGWCDRLRGMYRQWAANRHMQCEEAAPPAGGPPLVVVSGFGAARILDAEVGLHVLEYGTAGEEPARAAARVRVAPSPAVLPDAAAARHAALLGELNRSTASANVNRRYRLGASPLVRDVTRGWRTGRAELVLQGHFDLLADILRSE